MQLLNIPEALFSHFRGHHMHSSQNAIRTLKNTDKSLIHKTVKPDLWTFHTDVCCAHSSGSDAQSLIWGTLHPDSAVTFCKAQIVFPMLAYEHLVNFSEIQTAHPQAPTPQSLLLKVCSCGTELHYRE